MNISKSAKVATVGGAVAVVLFATACCLLYGRWPPGASLSGSGAASHALLESSLTRLSSAESSRDRLQAARWIGDNGTAVNSNVIQSLMQSLTSDPDPAVRAAVATTVGNLAARRNRGSAAPGPQEPMMVEGLAASFDLESNPAVRRCLVEAAGQFNHSEAATVLNKALVDADPSVREAAQEARLRRERRLLSAASG